MNWGKMAKYLLIAELIFISFVVLYILKIALAQTIGIGVSPAVLKYNFPAVYSQEFCFFNQGDTDAIYVIQSGDIRVLNEMNFTVSANTNFNNCIKKTLQLVVDKSGYFYVAAYPKVSQNATVSIVRRVGVKVELAGYSTQTTITQSVSGGGGNIQQATTTTTIRNQTSSNILVVRNETTSIIANFTSNVTIKNATNIANQTIENPKSNSGLLDILASMSGIFIVVIIIAFAYFIAVELGLI